MLHDDQLLYCCWHCGLEMKRKWNVDPEDPDMYLRLIDKLEGCTYFLDCLDEPETIEILNALKKKYYKLYFKSIKTPYESTLPNPRESQRCRGNP